MAKGDFRLFAGLGNPGNKYSNNRHNIGFMVLDNFASKKGIGFKEKNKLCGSIAVLKANEESIKLLKPNTFMNDSGISIRATRDWFDFNSNELIILVDDMDLPLGKIRIRSAGSSGGHNGLKSAIKHLGTTDFCRIRIGIGSPSKSQEDRKIKTNSHVLGNFSKEELLILNQVIDEVIICLELINCESFEKIVTRLNSFKYDPNIIK